jgi:hypothetical protein
MPTGDGTGSMETGPRTGQGRGMGPGRGRGSGRGHRWRNQFGATGLPCRGRMRDSAVGPIGAEPSPHDQVQALKAQAQQMARSLEEIRGRLVELETAEAEIS